MALNFPDSPTDGDTTAQPNGVTYIWRAAKTRWDVLYTPGSVGEFDAKLAGYDDSGVHIEYQGDLDAIAVNSMYNITGNGVTNDPPDFQATRWGFLRTDILSTAPTTHILQTLYGLDQLNTWKIWMRSKEVTWGAWKLVVDGSVGDGTWTPTITSTTPGDLSVTYTTQVGRWVKRGRLVSASFSILASAFTHTTASGTLFIEGLPFLPMSLISYAPRGSTSIFGITKPGFTQVNLIGNQNSSRLSVSATGFDPATIATVLITEILTGATPQFYGTIEYETDS